VVFVGLGILLGGLVGMLTLTVGTLPLTLTASGGALIMGSCSAGCGEAPDVRRIPEAALWVFDTIGLAVFIGVVAWEPGQASSKACGRPAQPAPRGLRGGVAPAPGGVAVRPARAEDEPGDPVRACAGPEP